MLQHTSSPLLRSVVAAVGCATAAAAIVLIWALRGQVDRAVYVSELGADGEPTAALFEVALLLVVLGGACVAWAGRGVRASVRLLGAWTVSTSIGVAAALFLVASQVPCTAGCPLPVGPSATLQDAVHTSSAVLAFAAACVAMLQASFAAGHRALRVLSMSCGLLVALVAAAGGVLSLLRFATEVGGVLEFVATSVAICWLVVFGGSTVARAGRPATPVVAPGPRRAAAPTAA